MSLLSFLFSPYSSGTTGMYAGLTQEDDTSDDDESSHVEVFLGSESKSSSINSPSSQTFYKSKSQKESPLYDDLKATKTNKETHYPVSESENLIHNVKSTCSVTDSTMVYTNNCNVVRSSSIVNDVQNVSSKSNKPELGSPTTYEKITYFSYIGYDKELFESSGKTPKESYSQSTSNRTKSQSFCVARKDCSSNLSKFIDISRSISMKNDNNYSCSQKPSENRNLYGNFKLEFIEDLSVGNHGSIHESFSSKDDSMYSESSIGENHSLNLSGMCNFIQTGVASSYFSCPPHMLSKDESSLSLTDSSLVVNKEQCESKQSDTIHNNSFNKGRTSQNCSNNEPSCVVSSENSFPNNLNICNIKVKSYRNLVDNISFREIIENKKCSDEREIILHEEPYCERNKIKSKNMTNESKLKRESKIRKNRPITPRGIKLGTRMNNRSHSTDMYSPPVSPADLNKSFLSNSDHGSDRFLSLPTSGFDCLVKRSQFRDSKTYSSNNDYNGTIDSSYGVICDHKTLPGKRTLIRTVPAITMRTSNKNNLIKSSPTQTSPNLASTFKDSSSLGNRYNSLTKSTSFTLSNNHKSITTVASSNDTPRLFSEIPICLKSSQSSKATSHVPQSSLNISAVPCNSPSISRRKPRNNISGSENSNHVLDCAELFASLMALSQNEDNVKSPEEETSCKLSEDTLDEKNVPDPQIFDEVDKKTNKGEYHLFYHLSRLI